MQGKQSAMKMVIKKIHTQIYRIKNVEHEKKEKYARFQISANVK